MKNNDDRVNEIIAVLNKLIAEPPKTRRIGFNIDNS